MRYIQLVLRRLKQLPVNFFFFSVLPSGRSLAPISSTIPCLQPSSSFLHTHPSFFSLNYFSLHLPHFSLPLHPLSRFLGHLTFLLLVCLPVFSPPFSLPSYSSITHFLSAHILSNSSFSVLLF